MYGVYLPAFSTHNYKSEGGNKTHIAIALAGSHSILRLVCGRKLKLVEVGDQPLDIQKYLASDVNDEVCVTCKRRILTEI